MYILYSFRRCPYAMRCRMVLEYSRLPFLLREISLKSKPPELRQLSDKETPTVPILHQPESGFLLEESWDIMKWALERDAGKFDTENWWVGLKQEQKTWTEQICSENDGRFKFFLDRYKYPTRYRDAFDPDARYLNKWDATGTALNEKQFRDNARRNCEQTLAKYEECLRRPDSRFLLGRRPGLADVAVMSFVRQFAHVTPPKENHTEHDTGDYTRHFTRNFPALSTWLTTWKQSELFLTIMDKCYSGYSPPLA
ncbi:glutathione S-transferase N-terminal domain-containing protein [Candidatus Haliotispira prima]|uniref:Glutathione S-transferase N-terminal domain-containing protein n=1 Tax=Candidatus Haliotispira prima TaxID=3034016 RepID=A0ABY8MHC3_9SPIO|nr:glutathione S-transferase N-terminal domain-containing protein [Candidatus Haliotispira prima]